MNRHTLENPSRGEITARLTGPGQADPVETSAPGSIDSRAALYALRLADRFMKMHRWSETSKWLNQAIKLQPKFFEAHFLYGEVHLELGAFEDAIEAFQKAIQLRPKDPTPRLKLGQAYLALDDWTSAQQQYQALRQLNEVIANELFDKIVYAFNYGMFESLFTRSQEAK